MRVFLTSRNHNCTGNISIYLQKNASLWELQREVHDVFVSNIPESLSALSQ
jgi:hypothetical protein